MQVYYIFQGVAAGLMLGFSIAVPPGPVNATTAQKIGSGKSWLSGFSVGCGAMTADAIFLLLTYLGWTRIISGNPSSTSWSYLAGGVIMTVFGALTILGLRKKHGRSSHMVSNGGGGGILPRIPSRTRVIRICWASLWASSTRFKSHGGSRWEWRQFLPSGQLLHLGSSLE